MTNRELIEYVRECAEETGGTLHVLCKICRADLKNDAEYDQCPYCDDRLERQVSNFAPPRPASDQRTMEDVAAVLDLKAAEVLQRNQDMPVVSWSTWFVIGNRNVFIRDLSRIAETLRRDKTADPIKLLLAVPIVHSAERDWRDAFVVELVGRRVGWS